MLKIATFLLALALAAASMEGDWAVFKRKYNKVYPEDEEILRRYVYQSNMKKIEEHNELYAKGEASYFMGENHLSDWTPEEVTRKMTGLKVEERLDSWKVANFDDDPAFAVPASVDWRDKGYVTDVKDQGACGSCYAFASTGTLEGQQFKATGKLVGLSESNIVDCSWEFGNNGCDGGLMSHSFDYIKANRGINSEKTYPYRPVEAKCTFEKSDIAATVTDYKFVKEFDEDALKEAVAKVGPISVAISCNDSFVAYKGGVFDDSKCRSEPQYLNHAVLVVGYGTENGKDFWLVKNSWSKAWGEGGYIKMSRNKNNQCGIATHAVFPEI